MARIDGFLFGYTVFSFEKEDEAAFANTLLRLGISARIKKNHTAEIRLCDSKRLRAELIGKMDFTQTEILGLPGILYRNRKRFGTFAGFIIAFALLFISSGFVWDVRVEGAEGEDISETLEQLSDAGVYVGARWSKIDKNAAEAQLLSLSDGVAWLNINRRGTVAYVTVKPKDSFEKEKTEPLYSNITANADAVIEEVNVKSGYALVKPGDAVKRGDILISGIIPGELGGGFCRAEGTVRGRVSEHYSVFVSESVSEKVHISEGKSDKEYKILGFSVNILKNSGNSNSMCDIIEYKSDVMLFGKYKLPIEKKITTEVYYEIRTRARTKEELVMCASKELTRLLSEELSDSELLKIKTGGEYTEGGYTMYSDVTALKNIGTEKEITLTG